MPGVWRMRPGAGGLLGIKKSTYIVPCFLFVEVSVAEL